jgi:hypothetical protein
MRRHDNCRLVAVLFLLFGQYRVAEAASLWGAQGGISDRVRIVPIDIGSGRQGAQINIPTGDSFVSVDDFASDPSNLTVIWTILQSGTQRLVAIDPVRAQIVSNTPISSTSILNSFAIDPADGTVYASSVEYGTSISGLFRIQTDVGETTLIGPTSHKNVNSLTFDSLGDLLGIVDDSKLVRVNKLSGETQLLGEFTVRGEVVNRLIDIAVNPEDGQVYGLGYHPRALFGGYALFQVDLQSRELTVVGASMFRPSGLAFTSVPEPGSAALALLGCGVLLAVAFQTHRGEHVLNRR